MWNKYEWQNFICFLPALWGILFSPTHDSEQHSRESVLFLLGWEQNVSTHMCENTQVELWLVNAAANASLSYDSNITCITTNIIIYRSVCKLFCVDITFDDVNKYTHRCDMEIQGIQAGKYATLADKLPISHNNVVGENTSSPTQHIEAL